MSNSLSLNQQIIDQRHRNLYSSLSQGIQNEQSSQLVPTKFITEKSTD